MRQNSNIKKYSNIGSSWLNSNCFCTKTRLYNTGGLVGVQRGHSSLRQFTFNNRWVRLFIYSSLHPSSLLSSVCLLCFLSLKKRATWRERRGRSQVRSNFRWRKENHREEVLFSYAAITGATHSRLPQVTRCTQAAVFLVCCDIVPSSHVISGSRCLLRQRAHNERVWLQQGEMLLAGNQSIDEMRRQEEWVALNC